MIFSEDFQNSIKSINLATLDRRRIYHLPSANRSKCENLLWRLLLYQSRLWSCNSAKHKDKNTFGPLVVEPSNHPFHEQTWSVCPADTTGLLLLELFQSFGRDFFHALLPGNLNQLWEAQGIKMRGVSSMGLKATKEKPSYIYIYRWPFLSMEVCVTCLCLIPFTSSREHTSIERERERERNALGFCLGLLL